MSRSPPAGLPRGGGGGTPAAARRAGGPSRSNADHIAVAYFIAECFICFYYGLFYSIPLRSRCVPPRFVFSSLVAPCFLPVPPLFHSLLSL